MTTNSSVFQPHNPPLLHQQLAFEQSKDKEYFGHLFKMGLGKSFSFLLDVGHAYAKGRINACVIIAPNGVHRKWLTQDIPFAFPPYLEKRMALWVSGNKKAMARCESLLDRGDFLRVLAVNIEAFASPTFVKFLTRFIQSTECIVGVDESQSLKNPKSLRSKELDKLRGDIAIRRILTGSGAVQNPVDLFGQFHYLDPKVLGRSLTAFKAEYLVLHPPGSELIKSIIRKNPHMRGIPQIAMTDDLGRPMYRNLDKLREKILPHCAIVRKEDVGMDFPKKVFIRHTFQMENKQRRLYDQLQKEMFLIGELRDHDDIVTVQHKMILSMRLQQLAAGFITPDGKSITSSLFDKVTDNPRIKLLLEAAEAIEDQCVVFCKFRTEADHIQEALGDSAVMYHGGVDDEQREINKQKFQQGEVKFIVGTYGAMHRGHDFQMAGDMIFYSHGWSADHREQAEDRIHRIGAKGDTCTYLDFEAEDSVEGHILYCLQNSLAVEKYLMRTPGQFLSSPPPDLIVPPNIIL